MKYGGMTKRNVYVWGLLAVGGLAVGAGLSMLSGRDPYDVEEVRGTLFEANPGLKKVLDFYEGDSLKHAAALYLIDNLGYHEGVDSADLRGLYRAYELFATGHYSYEQAMDSAVRAYGTAGVRDVRYFGPYKGYCNISEVAFYGSPSDSLPLQGTVIGPERGAYGDHSYFMAMDGQTDTSYDHPTLYDGWVGLDLGARKAVGRIAYSPRHRDNFVRPGDTYELFVCEGGEWKSAGTQVARSDSLVYHGVPQDAFLLLRNHTRGVDERIFEYKDGRQKFW